MCMCIHVSVCVCVCVHEIFTHAKRDKQESALRSGITRKQNWSCQPCEIPITQHFKFSTHTQTHTRDAHVTQVCPQFKVSSNC